MSRMTTRASTKASRSVDAMMAAKRFIDPSKLWMVAEPSVEEKLVLELARAIERDKDPDYVSTSWDSQVEAATYYNEHGFVEALTRLTDLNQKAEHSIARDNEGSEPTP